ncbi:MAG: DUF4440 domain-containing protein [Bryobacteraceae bacterium]|nr:DUF4440 domain-containing protein [Bryobacteraceae bacterium]
MRLTLLLWAAACAACAQTAEAEKQAVIQTVERTFQAMAARDAAALAALLLPGAKFFSVRKDGTVAASTDDEFVARIAAMKETPLERMWNPTVLLRGRLASLWADYDFHRAGKFSHCGVDSVQLLRTSEGWKIASIAYTVEQEGCAPSPLGPPAPPR